MAKLNFGGTVENVVTRDEFPLSKAQEVLKDEVVAVIGYGVQGPGQALNQKENGINVIVGQRRKGPLSVTCFPMQHRSQCGPQLRNT
jgi:ketol-acid reductoisomerase